MTLTADEGLHRPPPPPVAAGGVPEADGAAEPIEFDAFYHAHFRALTVQLCAYTGDLAQAQDVVQEAFCRAFSRWERVARFDDPVAWVRRVAWNLATSRWRRLRTAQRYLRTQRVEHVAGPTADRVDLTAALANLPATHRRAVVLHHLADMSVAEIALQEGVAEGAVKSWLHRGRVGLAAQLADRTEEHHHG
ncbi:SigE family RNA polymerase sigma factor [Micromonospora zhanjiangensis]|uniref:SigE family RNA polymerase sigma factor n=1 Tax=Micromonospora zhanjiangensis TaxID=1522057 RepID=A0ABV8KFI2_9ACTN